MDKFTIKSQEALQKADQLARGMAHQELTPEHLVALTELIFAGLLVVGGAA